MLATKDRASGGSLSIRVPAVKESQCTKKGKATHRCPPHRADWEETAHLYQGSEEGGKAFSRKRDLSRASKDLMAEEQKGLGRRKEQRKKRRQCLAKQGLV